MASQSRDVEILVHVTAPSRVADDATYRQIARGYLAFRPDVERRVLVARAAGSSSSQLPPSQNQNQNQNQKQGQSQSQVQAFGPDSQDLSFQSAIDNRSSPWIRRPSTTANLTSDTPPPPPPENSLQPSWRAPPSQISDSFPLPDASLVNVTPTRVLEHYLQHAAPSSSPSSSSKGSPEPSPSSSSLIINVPSSIPIPDEGLGGFDEDLRPNQGLAKVIPVTPAPHGRITSRKRNAPSDNDELEAGFDITHISNSFVSAIPSSSSSSSSSSAAAITDSEAPLPTSSPKKFSPENFVGTDTSCLAPASSVTAFHVVPSSNPSAVELIATTLDIVPPSPPVSVANLDLTSLVSSKLDKLAHDLSSRYKPSIHRQVDPWERGYWLVDCTSWTDSVRLSTWVFLTNYLQRGLAGWGVWCRRDELHEWIRFYCWGHVVKHTYLLLYLASGRQIKATGAKWFDGQGTLVLDAGGVEKQLSGG